MSLPNNNGSLEQNSPSETSDPEKLPSPPNNENENENENDNEDENENENENETENEKEKENATPSEEELDNLRQSLALLNRMLMPPPTFIPSYRRRRVTDKSQQQEKPPPPQADKSEKSEQSVQNGVGRGVIQCPALYNKQTKKTDTENCTSCRMLKEERDSGPSPAKKLKSDSCEEGQFKDVDKDSKDELETEKQKCLCADKGVKKIADQQQQQQETTFPVKIKLERLSTGEFAICKNVSSPVTENECQNITNG